jgi:hypothetical protein
VNKESSSRAKSRDLENIDAAPEAAPLILLFILSVSEGSLNIVGGWDDDL